MRTRRAVTVTVLAAVSAVLFAAMAPPDAFAGPHGLVGSWLVQGTPNGPPPFTNLATITRDGGVVNWDPTVGAGHGAWIRTGKNTFAVKFVSLFPPSDPSFPQGSMITVTATLTLDAGGDEATGPFLTVLRDTNGNELLSFEGTVALTRITVEE